MQELYEGRERKQAFRGSIMKCVCEREGLMVDLTSSRRNKGFI
jgi:hypothetical protein